VTAMDACKVVVHEHAGGKASTDITSLVQKKQSERATLDWELQMCDEDKKAFELLTRPAQLGRADAYTSFTTITLSHAFNHMFQEGAHAYVTQTPLIHSNPGIVKHVAYNLVLIEVIERLRHFYESPHDKTTVKRDRAYKVVFEHTPSGNVHFMVWVDKETFSFMREILEYRVVIDATKLDQLEYNRTLRPNDLTPGKCNEWTEDTLSYWWPPPQRTHLYVNGPATVPMLTRTSTSYEQFMSKLKTTANELPNSGEWHTAPGYLQAFEQSSQLMLKEGDFVTSVSFRLCYKNFCDQNDLEMVYELKDDFDAGSIAFLKSYNIIFQPTDRHNPFNGRLYNVASAPRPLQLPSDVNPYEIEKLREIADGKLSNGLWKLIPDTDPQVRKRKAGLLLLQVDEGSTSSG